MYKHAPICLFILAHIKNCHILPMYMELVYRLEKKQLYFY